MTAFIANPGINYARPLHVLAAVAVVVAITGCSRNESESAAINAKIATIPVSLEFERHIQPIFDDYCINCHGQRKSRGGLRLDDSSHVFDGDPETWAIVPGDPDASELIRRIELPFEDEEHMPYEEALLPRLQVEYLRSWILQGAIWGDYAPNRARAQIAQGENAEEPLTVFLDPPSLSHDDGHPVDALLEAHAASRDVTLTTMIDDAAFMRRVSLDVIGLLPDSDDIRSFMADVDPDKRASLVDRLLADRRGYAEHWMTLWNDLLRNDYAGTGYIDGGRTQITTWLYSALFDNLPYDEFVTALVAPSEQTRGFANGIKWRGDINESQSTEIQYAQSVSQVFLGINMKCASCHDSFINEWQLQDAYGLAAIFADRPLELYRCDVPTGQVAEPSFMRAEFGRVSPSASREERLDSLAEMLWHPLNGRTPRTIVNRVWARLMGRGLITPVDDASGGGWHPRLLDYLAADLVANEYDLKHLIRSIVTSEAYQRASVPDPAVNDSSYAFVGPVSVRMTAEQFVDAVWELTDTAPSEAHASVAERDDDGQRPVRAALRNSSPVMRSLGRPNREQIVSSRPRELTMLQALDLTNGTELQGWLRRGAEHLHTRAASEPEAWLDDLYLSMLARAPRADERAVARDILGANASVDAVEDLLWVMLMLPEFQAVK